MIPLYWIGLMVTVAVFGYLVFVLFAPEKFS
ncbi:MAG: K(+)-transporting ATPase subunit F [Magnetococcales bacterium]|nr:K(+)-transporting ATPase subunit F [Magnetococcales bacterium]